MNAAPLRLETVELLHVRRRLAKPFRISVGAVTAREFVVMRGHSDGLTVYSEANIDALPFYTYETIPTVWHIAGDVLLPSVLGKRFDSIQQVRDTWSHVRGHAFAKAAVEHLFWDLRGKLENKSLRELVGGEKTEIEVGTSHSIFPTAGQLVDDIRAVLTQGIRRIKIKIQPGWDVEPLAAIRRELGDIPLLVDANGAYDAGDIETLQSLDQFNLLMLEQPLAAGDIVDHRDLRQRIRTPICFDESAEDFHMVQSALKIGAADIINIKVARVGGITESIRIHDLCRNCNVPVWCGRRTGSGISLASELAIASLPGFVYPSDHGVDLISETEDHLVDLDQFQPRGPVLRVPTGPGIGVAIDEKTLQRITLRQESFRA